MIDLVVPYVNTDDPKWLYQKRLVQGRYRTVPGGAKINRFRDLDTFKYLIRGVAKYAPWINTVYVVLQMPSQKPEWLKESDRLKIIYHDQIIPKKLLPTYNSCTIETFLWKIPNLSETFIFTNDDMIPVAPLKEEDFFEDGVPKLRIVRLAKDYTPFQAMKRNCEVLVRDILKLPQEEDNYSLCDGHSWSPMLKSTWQELFKQRGDQIMKSCSTFRVPTNLPQHLATFYDYLSNNYKERDIKTVYFELSRNTTKEGIEKAILNSEAKIVCLNDGDAKADTNALKIMVDEVMDVILKDKCIYENS